MIVLAVVLLVAAVVLGLTVSPFFWFLLLALVVVGLVSRSRV